MVEVRPVDAPSAAGADALAVEDAQEAPPAEAAATIEVAAAIEVAEVAALSGVTTGVTTAAVPVRAVARVRSAVAATETARRIAVVRDWCPMRGAGQSRPSPLTSPVPSWTAACVSSCGP